jgi:prepilin-type N-terminal cleavage/methylation domain-containing protein
MIGKRGFTLIEVLIVVIILGILATIAVPQFTKMMYRARTAEAYSTMGALKTALEVYKLEHTTYTDVLGDLDITFPDGATGSPNFDYEITNADDTTYTIEATGKEKAAGVIVTMVKGADPVVDLP